MTEDQWATRYAEAIDPGGMLPARTIGGAFQRDRLTAVMAVADEELAGLRAEVESLRSRLGLASRTLTAERADHEAEVERLEVLLNTMDHFAEVAETCDRKSNEWAARVRTSEAELRALRECIATLADARDVKYPERFQFAAGDNHVAGYRQAQADLRALLAPSPAATTGEADRDEVQTLARALRAPVSSGEACRHMVTTYTDGETPFQCIRPATHELRLRPLSSGGA